MLGTVFIGEGPICVPGAFAGVPVLDEAAIEEGVPRIRGGRCRSSRLAQLSQHSNANAPIVYFPHIRFTWN
jgi:hypothetical protein